MQSRIHFSPGSEQESHEEQTEPQLSQGPLLKPSTEPLRIGIQHDLHLPQSLSSRIAQNSLFTQLARREQVRVLVDNRKGESNKNMQKEVKFVVGLKELDFSKSEREILNSLIARAEKQLEQLKK